MHGKTGNERRPPISQDNGASLAYPSFAGSRFINRRYRTVSSDEKVNAGIVAASKHLRKEGNVEAAEGICTTDTFVKEYAVEVTIGNVPVRIGGIAKGSGMIAPNMATMLAFVTTDANISHSLLNKTLQRATEMSFNRITVDGDTSTNDMVLVLANRKADNALLKENSPAYTQFYKAFEHVLTVLSKMIVKDGEGATKFIEVTVKGARSKKEAEAAGRTICNSLLVKTAIHGEDANWGRILAAVGRSGILSTPTKQKSFSADCGFSARITIFPSRKKKRKKSCAERNYDHRRSARREPTPQHYGRVICRKAISILMRATEVRCEAKDRLSLRIYVLGFKFWVLGIRSRLWSVIC